MLSIDRRARNQVETSSRILAGHNYGERRILPRLLRRPVRMTQRILSGDANISWRVKFALGLLVFGLSFAVFVTNTKTGAELMAQISAGAGFAVEGVRIDGTTKIAHAKIVETLDFGDHKSMLAFDVHKARNSLRKLPWVSDAIISKAFPDYLDIRIVESKPYAIWQDGNQLALIERGGDLIDNYDAQYAHLPLFVGKGANKSGAEIHAQVERSKSLAGEVKAYIRVADRRWDLLLKSGVRIRLPGDNVLASLSRFDRIEKSTQILARDLQVIDLRHENQLVVQLPDKPSQSENALDGQAVSLKKQAKNASEKQI